MVRNNRKLIIYGAHSPLALDDPEQISVGLEVNCLDWHSPRTSGLCLSRVAMAPVPHLPALSSMGCYLMLPFACLTICPCLLCFRVVALLTYLVNAISEKFKNK